jgi:hypothetical protein
MAPKKKSRTNLATASSSRHEVLPEAEPPDPTERSPNKDPVQLEDEETRKDTRTSMPLSGDECHVTTEIPAESPDLPTAWKGKARSLSPQQFRPRETFLSPKQTKSAVFDRREYVFPTTEEEVPSGRVPSSVRARTPEVWTSTGESNDSYGNRKAHRKEKSDSVNPVREGLLPANLFDESFWQQQDHPAAKTPNPMQSTAEVPRSRRAKSYEKSIFNQFDEDANISSAYETIHNPRRRDGETSDDYKLAKLPANASNMRIPQKERTNEPLPLVVKKYKSCKQGLQN